MCSNICPCTEDAFDVKYNGYTALELEPFDRSPALSVTSNKLVKKDSGTTFTTFNECYEANKDNSKFTTGEQAKQFFAQGGMKFIASLENEADCAGLCYTPLWYLGKDIKLGRPTTDCATKIVKEYGGSQGVGVSAIITGLVFFTAAIGSIPLCKGFSPQGDDGAAF